MYFNKLVSNLSKVLDKLIKICYTTKVIMNWMFNP